jgi:cytochrome d ubiquinol oxidase subunit II
MTLWVAATIQTFKLNPHMIDPFKEYPILGVIPLISLGCILTVLWKIRQKRDGIAFLFSCLTIFFLMALFAIGTFPNIVYSTINPEQNSLTFMNSSVSELALWIMVGVALTGAPLSFFYFPYVYRVFKGKVELDSHSY